MELGTILNSRLTAHAGTGPLFGMQHTMQHDLQPQHYAAAPNYINGRIKSENGSERGVSPHPSDSSRYSSQAPQQLPSYPMAQQHMNGMRYPSPTAMQSPGMPLMNNGNYIPNPPDHTYAQQQQQQPPPEPQHPAHAGGRPTNENGPPKAFACSTCGKGFARRSDLARHGMEALTPREKPSLTQHRAHPQRHPPSRVRLSQLRQAVHSAVSADGPPTCPHRREAPHV